MIYAAAWMYDSWHPDRNQVEIGFNSSEPTFFDSATGSIAIFNVMPASPAEHAGLRAGDQIVALDGQQVKSYALMGRIWGHAHPGDSVDITVRRKGSSEPLTFHAVFRMASTGTPAEGVARASAREVLSFFPIMFIVVGFAVLFLRLEHFDAWLLALLFVCFISVSDFNNPDAYPHAFAVFIRVYRAFFFSCIASAFYIFFALFPEKSPLERRAPWLKWVALAIGLIQVVPGFDAGTARLPAFFIEKFGATGAGRLRYALTYSLTLLAIISLVWNCTSATSAGARRKSRVLLAGLLLGVCPFIVVHSVMDFTGYHPSFWMNTILSLLVLLYPLLFAYAIIKHRVLEIPVLLRRSARYVLVQRGYFLLLFCAALLTIFVFTHLFSSLFSEHSQFAMVLSAAFGVGLVWVSSPLVKQGTDRIDRAFFRSSYDARVILQDLTEKARTVSNRNELAALLDQHLSQAFHPQSLAIYFRGNNGVITATGRPVPPELTTLQVDSPFLRALQQHGRAWDVPPADDPNYPQPPPLSPLSPECLVPLLGHEAKMVGLLVLGRPLSEEPYSREDKRLLDSVAGQAAVSLENMSMAEQIADRLELDRRAEHEMHIAREVQSHLFPKTRPPLATLEYAGNCIQARQVGGDYYDFWDFGANHLAIVLADISGKGISGALLMANLQANLRSRSTMARQDMLNVTRDGQWLPGLLKSVNQLFYENTPDDRYATLFLAVYDDKSRQLEYANCGHNPPLLFRATGQIERLEPTATVIGIAPHWECTTQTVTLCPKDVLVIYTDGVTEANDAQGNEFGEERLRQVVRANLTANPPELLQAIETAVQQFSAGEQFDDLTLVVARAL
ncbi:MAG TPA: SpoIIE family protein phosphatase [Verrucomicrobiae bacterium]|nr:SpoIIE family protein phosphatase [Verrucomicrobiae bacterium]